MSCKVDICDHCNQWYNFIKQNFLFSQVNGVPVTVGVGSVTSEDGYSLLLSPAAAGSIWSRLLDFGAVPMGTLAWERLRVLLGFPLSRLLSLALVCF